MSLNAERLRHVLQFFGHEEGQDGGGFAMGLLELMAHADRANRSTLARAFPMWGAPFALVKDDALGLEVIARAAQLLDAGVIVQGVDVLPGGWVYLSVRYSVPLEQLIAGARPSWVD